MQEPAAAYHTDRVGSDPDSVNAEEPSSTSAAQGMETAGDTLNPFLAMPPIPHPLRHPLLALAWLLRALFGLIALIVILVLLLGTPGANVYVLGFLLDVQGRVASTGRLRYALPLIPVAIRIGTASIAILSLLLPLSYLAGFARDARWIAPGGLAVWGWNITLAVATALVALHMVLALARGGTIGCFLRPIKNVLWIRQQLRSGEYWRDAHAAVRNFVEALQVPRYFRLGIMVLAGTYAWVLVPAYLYTVLEDTSKTWQWVVTILGGVLLVPLLCWLPFLQVRLAVENRWRAILELGAVREMFLHAPLSWMLATLALYGLAVPRVMYYALLRVQAPPHPAIWDVMFVFLMTIYPAKVFLGWAYGRAMRRGRSWRTFQWIGRTVCMPAVGLYVFLLFHAMTSGQLGRRILFEQHALLLPFPY